MGEGANVRAVVLLVLLCILQRGEAIWLSLPASGTKCVSEEIQSNVVVLADYVVISDDHVHSTPTISAKVRVLLPFFFLWLPPSYYFSISACVVCLFLQRCYCYR